MVSKEKKSHLINIGILLLAIFVLILAIEATSFLILSFYYGKYQGGSEYIFNDMKRYLHPVIGKLFFLNKYNRPNGWINSNYVFEFDRYSWLKPIPGISYSGRMGKFTTKYAHNQDGFMDIDTSNVINKEKNADEFRIFILGGSTAMGVGTEDMSKTIASYLEKELKGRISGKQVKVINAGVGGFTSFQEYMYLVVKISRYHPDMIITFDGSNDASDTTAALASGDLPDPYNYGGASTVFNNYNFLLISETLRYLGYQLKSYLSRISDYSYFLFGINQAKRKFKTKMRSEREAAKLEYQANREMYKEILQFYPGNIREIIRYCLCHEYFVFCVLQPHIFNGKKVLHPEEGRLYKLEGQRLFCAALDSFAQSFRSLQKEYENDDRVLIRNYDHIFENVDQEIYIDGTHYNSAGNLIIAQRMAGDILQFLGRNIRNSSPNQEN